MKKLLYILLLLPFAAMAQEVPTVNGYKIFLDNKQVDITHYFIDPNNVKDIHTDREVREVYITLNKKNNLVKLSEFVANTKSQFDKLKDDITIVIIVDDKLIENPESYFIECSAITAIETYIGNGEGHMAHTPTIKHYYKK